MTKHISLQTRITGTESMLAALGCTWVFAFPLEFRHQSAFEDEIVQERMAMRPAANTRRLLTGLWRAVAEGVGRPPVKLVPQAQDFIELSGAGYPPASRTVVAGPEADRGHLSCS
ncbi:hypothetical protein OU426_02525 [Frigidibacter sp. RF13]|uniref:hypothetical protein n=1 Tax=Frigidibacter sp. RF13 TaxID=2997340 RepID=UPI00226FA983|nr:hypothetical protein [Frigidibacter sp. RF13]MCY1125718.1 hypothetical protein [Frigidibacter sp. RF13]